MFSIFDLFTIKKRLDMPWRKFYKKEELDYKIPNITMYDEVKNSATKYPNNIAIKYMGRNIKYKKLIKKIDICAKGFSKLGVKKGDIVTVLLPNVPEVLICLYALNKLGAIANMTHPLSATDEIKETLISTKSEYLIMYDARYQQVKDFIKEIGVKKVIFVSPADSLRFPKNIGYRVSQIKKFVHPPISNLFMNFKGFYLYSILCVQPSFPKLGKNTPAVILHSGGTSGKPKNVVLQNRTFIYSAFAESVSLSKLGPGDSALAIMPNFHGFGLSLTMHTPLALGYASVMVPKFNAKKLDVLIKKSKATCILGVPTLFEALISNENKEHADLSFIKYVISGGDILPKTLEDKVNDYLERHNSQAKIVQGYGLSEALACVTIATDGINKSGSVGIPMVGNYVKIINPATRKTVPYGQTGEIVVNGKALMLGYLNEESETNDALQVHDDGHVWLHTGDMGMMDHEGFLFYKGRIKRMIITSGYNVYPSHIEEVLESHPAVLQCTVVGVPHPYKQEVPKAFVVLNDDVHDLFIKYELKNYCKEKLAKYMIPADIVIRKQLPKTKLGKVDFKKLQSDKEKDEY